MSEETRRNIDAVIEKDEFGGDKYYESKSPFDKNQNFVHNYLEHSTADDLEAMSKWLKPKAVMTTTSATNKLKLSE